MKTGIVKSKIKCPKCKRNTLYLIEVWTAHTIEWEQIDGKFDPDDGNLEVGDPHHLEAKCIPCKHQWRVRGAGQIGSAIIDETPIILT